MSQQEPEYVWSFPPEKMRHPGRVWLIVGLSVAFVAIAVVLLLLFLPRSAPVTDPTGSPTPSAPVTPNESPSPTPTATSSPAPTTVPTQTTSPATPPPPADPSLAVFRDKIRPVLTDADTGLRMLGTMSGPDAQQIVDQLRQDAERLSDSVAPSSIADDWNTRTDAYLNALSRLNEAYAKNSGIDKAREAAASAEQSLKELVGL
ncbi:hypothetical protein DY023_00080 [Microbacterium bovistercoris]|uniref:Uncharacterized protein n=1 Tax=Microbacterium bovistercoris TaxID=2293570 RepID=A0A371NYL8_9MICO|nr:hypothetical protein [Microbacterium bovistercoris]REJ08930.1 hypothetical protein DY023_00080 [Microbacterium bovistercoris]